MKFTSTELAGATIIELDLLKDHRGFFARCFCEKEFQEVGLESRYVQCNTSWNEKKGILRGMHYQVEPYAEVKLVRCTRGSIYDVIIDLRENSPTRGKWIGIELSAENRKMLYVPTGFAHGYQTLEPDTEVFYMVSEFYTPGSEKGIRWNDPAFQIDWPLSNPILSEKDKTHPDYRI